MANQLSAAERRSQQTEQEQLPSQARQQMAALTESTASLFKSVEALQQVHQHAAQRSALRLQQTAEQLRSANSAAELMSIQSTLWLSGVQEWTQYLQDMSMTLVRIQARTMKRPESAQAQQDAAETQAEASVVRPMSAATDATSAATLAVLKSWSNMMGGFTSGDSRSAH